MLFYETTHRKERNDGKDTTDTDFSVPAASAEKAEDFLLLYIRIFLGNKQLHIKVPSAAVQYNKC